MNDGGPAFPVTERTIDCTTGGEVASRGPTGMTLRDYFAAQVMAATITHEGTPEDDYQRFAGWSYAAADAMLAAREPHG